MADLDLRPLSLGEILDRTFSLYRNNFLLFAGIAAIPQILILAVNLVETLASGRSIGFGGPHSSMSSGELITLGIVGAVVGLVVWFVAYLFAQGGTVFAVSDLYLGRATTIGDSLRRVRGHALNLLGVILLNGIAVAGATLLLIIPGIWLACRLVTCVPAALLEDLGASDSLERSFQLTEDSAGRAFVIYLIYFVVGMIASVIFKAPFDLLKSFAAAQHPDSVPMWTALSQVGDSIAQILVTPILLIGTAIFYFDLRVRKEAFDLQIMMNPASVAATPKAGSLPSMLS